MSNEMITCRQCGRQIEVKGGYRGPGWEQGMERHRRARDCFSTYFLFTLATVKGGKIMES